MYRRIVQASIVALALHGCGSSDPSSAQIAQPTQNRSVGEALRDLEATGQIPKLDRSTNLRGLDVDGDGLRDDLARYIDGLPESAKGKATLRQFAMAVSNALASDKTDDKSLRAAGIDLRDSVFCLVATFGGVRGDQYREEISTLVVNTKERFVAYAEYNQARNGSVTRAPSGDGCR